MSPRQSTTASLLELRRVGRRSWVVFHPALSIQVAWPVWATRADAERFRRTLDELSGWDHDAITLQADVGLGHRVHALIARLEAERHDRRHYGSRLAPPANQQLSAHRSEPAGTTRQTRPSGERLDRKGNRR
jgi:hypothetical protein